MHAPTDRFSSAFNHLHLLKHPFYQAWMEGTIPRETLRDYAKQYFYHVDRFPRYLSALHSICENTENRRRVLENLNEEEGVGFGSSHPDLWLQFAEGMGAPREEVLGEEPRAAIRNVAETFFRFARKSFHEGLGALYAYESQVPEIAQSKIEGLVRRYGVSDDRTLSFFEVHRAADVEHRRILLEILENLPEDQKLEAQEAGRQAAESLWNFLSDVHHGMACAS